MRDGLLTSRLRVSDSRAGPAARPRAGHDTPAPDPAPVRAFVSVFLNNPPQRHTLTTASMRRYANRFVPAMVPAFRLPIQPGGPTVASKETGSTCTRTPKVLNHVQAAGWSVQHIVCGSGGGLLQKVNRDTSIAFRHQSQLCHSRWRGARRTEVDCHEEQQAARPDVSPWSLKGRQVSHARNGSESA